MWNNTKSGAVFTWSGLTFAHVTRDAHRGEWALTSVDADEPARTEHRGFFASVDAAKRAAKSMGILPS